jgi:hypothetical protein
MRLGILPVSSSISHMQRWPKSSVAPNAAIPRSRQVATAVGVVTLVLGAVAIWRGFPLADAMPPGIAIAVAASPVILPVTWLEERRRRRRSAHGVV